MQTGTDIQAFTVKDFMATYSVGRTKFYEEVKAGRLRIRKMGKRTLIAKADAEEWLNSLPTAT